MFIESRVLVKLGMVLCSSMTVDSTKLAQTGFTSAMVILETWACGD